MEIAKDITGFHLGVLLWGILLAAFTSLIAASKGFYRLPHSNQQAESSLGWTQVIVAFSLFIAIEILFLPFLFGAWLAIKDGIPVNVKEWQLDETTKLLLNVVGILLAFVMLGLYFISLSAKQKESVWGHGSQGWLHNLGLGSITWWIAFPWMIIIGQLFRLAFDLLHIAPPNIDQVAVKYVKEAMTQSHLFWPFVLCLILIVPFVEELLFRGFLQSKLKSVVSTNKAIFITSLLFAAFHFSETQGLENIELLISLFVLSCFLGFLRERQDNLMASIGLHSTFNLISILMISYTS